MSAEYAGKRQRVGQGDGLAAAAINHAKTSTTSSADLESMLKQALDRIDSLERQHEEMKTSMERETKALRDDIETLKSKNKALEWSLDRLARKAQEGWEYRVAIQPDEYWRNKGYDDQDIECLKEDFLGELKTAVSDLEHGVCDLIKVGYMGYVDHDEDLMPHWNSLFRSFDYINPHDAGVELDLRYIELNEQIMREICHHVRHKNIRMVSFSSNRFSNMRVAINELENALQSPRVNSFKWFGNPIESVEDMNLFTRAISRSNALDELRFAWNSNESARAFLSTADLSMYKVLNFNGNDLQTNGRTDIPDLIAANTPLEELDLYYNRLNDDDAVLMAQALGRNTHLRKLNIGRNNIQERGRRALYEAVNGTSTLNALSDSNHSCRLEGLTQGFDILAINLESGSNGLYRNRMFKIHKLMMERYCDGDGNVPHLNKEMRGEGAVLLAPYLMESVVRRHDVYAENHDESIECSLGLLYELLKDWKMSELFSFR
ncbi:hypothetical protein THAOC_28970 [Thalassiosira oceanica]|uniref:Uncharacterized protein n=1 Tax=Thalassiosira oceanica TaxID=159749 RepID=K0RF15_THAOC|nr:hypothetical protein THAOC_28970 [Thalassiosira oceanica]|eukprot:EJK51825.1 hypothetical protein THAOC_28970 [Thalassiosira oceanica]